MREVSQFRRRIAELDAVVAMRHPQLLPSGLYFAMMEPASEHWKVYRLADGRKSPELLVDPGALGDAEGAPNVDYFSASSAEFVGHRWLR
jgi:hypothetical protein